MSNPTQSLTQSHWRGGVSPLGVGWNKLMMWLFIVTDGLLFAAFLASYGFARFASPRWPEQLEIFHLWFIALMTFVLITSSATMATAVAVARRGDGKTVSRFLMLTVAGGAIFLGMQAYEWATLIGEGATLHSNPWGVPQFTAYFFLTTGFHGSHVFSGVLILAATAWRWKAGLATAAGVELAGLYWHFVDLVWVFIFTLFYLI